MKKIFPSYVRVPVFLFLVFAGLEYFIDSGSKPAFIEYPLVSLALFIFLFVLIALETVYHALENVKYQLLSPEEKLAYEAEEALPFTESKLYKTILDKLTRTKSIEQEADVMLEHDYDGIRELDNVLPPWWVYLFYGSVIFAIVYMVRFHVVGDYTQKEEYEMAMAQAQKEQEIYELQAPDLINLDNVIYLADEASIEEGKQIYLANNCVSCHKANLEGNIGPNLVDAYWVNGGGIKNIFKVISEGSPTNTVMAPWKEVIKPTDIQKLSSYILSLNGTNPPGAKEAEGEIWVDAPENADTTSAVVNDSLTK